MDKNRAGFIKLKVVKYCILNGCLYWKDPRCVLLNFLLEDEAKKISNEFHEGDCGGHHYWKAIVNNILRVGFYWPTMFFDKHKEMSSCHKCQIFEGNGKLSPLSLKHIYVEAPFQKWGLNFIGEISRNVDLKSGGRSNG